MAESIEDLYVVLTGNAAPLLATFTQVTAAGEEMVTALTASMAELKATMAETTVGAGVGAGAEGAAAVEAANAELVTSMGEVGAASASMATEVDSSYAGMASKAEASAAGVAAAQRETAAAGTEASAAMAGAAASTEAAAAKSTVAADGLSKAGGLVSQAMFGAKLGIAAAAVESVKMAGDFQSATERLALSAGEDQKNIDMVRQGMLTMAGQVGYSADQLATAMYKIESGGQHGADGLKVLQAAAEGAKTENADLTTVADALTSAMTDYHLPASQAADVTSKLVAATSQGKMTFQELAGSLAAVLPVASANHVALNDILGDEASMTMHGMSAEQATQNLADAIRHMAAPTQAQAKELAALGMNATEVSKDLGEKGLSGTINDISNRIQSQMGPDGMVVVNLTNALKGMAPPVQELGQKVLDGSMSMKEFTASAKAMGVINDKQVTSFAALAGSMHGIGTEAKSGAQIYQTYSGALRQAMGDATGMNVALMIGGENASNTARAISAVSGATAEAGGHVKGWSEIQQTFNQQWAEFKDGLGAAAIQIGTALLPAVGALLSVLGTVFKILADHPVLIVGLAAVIATALAPAIWAATTATAAWTVALLSNPLTWFAVLVGIVAMGAYELIEHWRGVASFFTGIWHAIEAVFHGIGQAWDSFVGGFQNPTAKLADSVRGIDRIFLELGEGAKRALDDTGRFLGRAWDVITTPFRDAWAGVKRIFEMSPAQLGEALGRLAGELARKAFDAGKSLETGIVNGAQAVWTWLKALPGRVRSGVVDAAHWLWNTGLDVAHGLEDGIKSGAQAVWDWIKALPGRIRSGAVDAVHWLWDTGVDTAHGLQTGAEAGAQSVWDWLKALPGRILAFVEDAPHWLYDTGASILHGLWDGFTSFIGNIFSGIGDFIHGFISGFLRGFGVASPSTVMFRIGADVIIGLWNGFISFWGNVFSGIGNFIQGVISQFSGSATWLVSAGYNLLVGIWNGIASGWGWLMGKVSSLATSIKNAALSALGISSPSKVFADEVGAWIAPGIAEGIEATAYQAITAAQQLASRVTAAATGTGGGFTLSGTSAAGGSAISTGIAAAVGGGGSGMVLNVNVAGHVWTTGDLVKELQKQLIQHNIRNTSNATSYSYA